MSESVQPGGKGCPTASERGLLNVLPRTILGFPFEGKLSGSSACGTVYRRKSNFILCNALSRYTSSPPAGGAVSLRLVSVAVPQAELRFSVSPGDRFIAAPLLRSPQGEAKVGVMPRGLPNKCLLPRIRKLSPLCTISRSVTAPGLPVPWGVSGGGAALSSLCRRFPGGDIMNLTSRRSPLSVLSWQSRSLHEQRMA